MLAQYCPLTDANTTNCLIGSLKSQEHLRRECGCNVSCEERVYEVSLDYARWPAERDWEYTAKM